MQSKSPGQIEIVEVSPRDGLQNEPVQVSTVHKLSLVKRAVQAGARRVEAVSFVSPKAVPQMADAEALMAAIRADSTLQSSGARFAGLVLNRRGLDRAISANVDEINFVVLASETFNQRNQRATIAETLSSLAACCEDARAAGLPVSVTIGASFGCPFEGEVSEGRVLEIASECADLGVDEIALADTIGVANPLAIERLFGALREALQSMRLRAHLHDTRNTGVANAYAASRAGVSALDASIGGIGGCPFAPAATGNVATEDLVYMFSRMGVETELDLETVRAAACWLQDEVLEKTLPSALLRAGGFPFGERTDQSHDQAACIADGV